MILNVPYFKQDTAYSCGAASLQMAFDFFGFFESESKIAKEAHTEPVAGTKHQGMIDVATSKGFYCYVNNESSLDEIIYFLHLKLPIIVHFIEPSGDEGHYSIVTEVKNDTLVMNDPWNGKNFHMKVEDFLERWHSEYNSSTRWLMVISKEKISLGKQYLPQ